MKNLNFVRPCDETSARNFFDWPIVKRPILDVDGLPIVGFSEYRNGKTNETLHVGNSGYAPWQPLAVFELAIQAIKMLGKPYSVVNAGSYDGDKNIFAQFKVGDGKFTLANGKEMSGLLTLSKGNNEKLPVDFWLTVIMIVCQNTYRAAQRAKRGNASRVTRRQTKNSQADIDTIAQEIAEVLGYQESVQATLNRMSQTPITIIDAQRAFLGLVRREIETDETGKLIPIDLSKTGRTHLSNTLDRFDNAFKLGKGANTNTREGWFAGVTNLATHGNQESKKFDATKQYLSSEFGTQAKRKEYAFEMAADDQAFAGLVASGEEIMSQLLARPVVVAQGFNVHSTDFARLLGS